MRRLPIHGLSGLSGLSVAAVLAAGCVGSIDAPTASEPGAPDDAPPSEASPRSGDRPAGGTPAASKACALPPARIWKLTPRQYDNSVRALLASAPAATDRLEDLAPTGDRKFHNEADHRDLSLAYITQLSDHAELIAGKLLEDPARLAPCLGGATPDNACLSGAFSSLLERAHRRPPTTVELSATTGYYHSRLGADGHKSALGAVVSKVLMSPNFLFRTELGAVTDKGETFTLDAHETAAALSYFLLDGPPDAALRTAATTGKLRDVAGLASEARRLLAEPSAARGLLRFFGEHTETHTVTKVSKDAAVYPRFSSALAADMEAEVGRFVAHVLKEEGGKLETLLSAPYSVISPRLADLYQVPAPSTPWGKVTFPSDQRAGLITQAALLATHARADHGDPVVRGRFLRERFLCGVVPLPANDVPPLPEVTSAAGKPRTMRERLAQHTADPACRVCHQLLDPLGLPLERYDGIGQWRTREGTYEIDPSGALNGMGDPVPYRDAIEMARSLATHPRTRSCFVESVFTYAYGRAPTEADSCELARLTRGFEETSGNVVDLVVDTVASTHFTQRRSAR